MNKQERLQEVYRYLVFSHKVEKQKDLAKALNRNENNISRALKGDPKCLTDRFFKSIAARYPFISLAWLLTGEGNMLNQDEPEAQQAKAPAPATPPSSASPSLAQALEDRYATLCLDLESELKQIRTIRADLESSRNDMEKSSRSMTNATTSILSAALTITQSLSSINDRISDLARRLDQLEVDNRRLEAANRIGQPYDAMVAEDMPTEKAEPNNNNNKKKGTRK
jgi:hypothetical protein